MYFAYILISIKDNKYYYGSCADLQIRREKHNKGHVKSTKNRRPFAIHYFEKFEPRKEAFKREQYFKTINGYIWLKENKII